MIENARIMKPLLLFMFFAAGCASGSGTGTGGTSQADCDKIAEEIRMYAGAQRSQGICASKLPADVDRFGKACAALKDCQDHVTRP